MATTPIVKIPVDDSEFKKFSESWNEYRDQLKEMPEDWQMLNRQIGEFAKFQKSIGLSSEKSLSNALDAFSNYNKALRTSTKESAKLSIVFRDLSTHSRAFMQDVTGGVSGLTRAAGGLGDAFGGIVGAAGAAAAAIAAAIAGINKLGEGAQSQVYSRRVIGSSTGKIKAFANVYQSIFGSESAAENFAARLAVARTQPADLGAFALLGLSNEALNKNIGGVQFAEDVTKRLSRFAQRYGGNPIALGGLATQSGITSLLPGGMADLLALAHHKGGFSAYEAQVRRRANPMNITPVQQHTLVQAHKEISKIEKQIGAAGERFTAEAIVNGPHVAAHVMRQQIKGTAALATGSIYTRAYTEFSKAFTGLPEKLRSFGSALDNILHELTGKHGPKNGFNYGNIKNPKTGEFLKFPTAAAGAKALAFQLNEDIYQHHQNTLRQLVYGNAEHGGWTKTQRAAHLQILESVTGLGANQTIPQSSMMLAKLMAGTALAEGYGKITPSTMARLAGIQGNTPAKPRRMTQQPPTIVIRNNTSAQVHQSVNASIP